MTPQRFCGGCDRPQPTAGGAYVPRNGGVGEIWRCATCRPAPVTRQDWHHANVGLPIQEKGNE